MHVFWSIIFALVFIYVIFILPMATLIYEADPDDGWKKILCGALCQTGIYMTVVFVLLLIFWGSTKDVRIPIKMNAGGVNLFQTSANTSLDGFIDFSSVQTSHAETELGFEMFMIVGTSFIGWFLFTMFGGIGFVILPVDLILYYVNRPVLKSPKEMAETCVVLRKMTGDMIEKAKKIKEDKRTETQGGYFAKLGNKKANEKD